MEARTAESHLDDQFQEKYFSKCSLVKNKEGEIVGKIYTAAKSVEVVFLFSDSLEAVETGDQVLLQAMPGPGRYPVGLTIIHNKRDKRSLSHRNQITFRLIKRIYPRFL